MVDRILGFSACYYSKLQFLYLGCIVSFYSLIQMGLQRALSGDREKSVWVW